MDKIRILHISDLHYGKDVTKANENLEKFFEDIEKQEQFDLIIFSGDLANIGNLDNLNLTKQLFLDVLMKKTNLNYENFFISPGNHDINRKDVLKHEKKLKKLIKSKEEINDIIKDKEDDMYINKLNDFYNFKVGITKNYINHNKIYSTHLIEIKGKKIGISCMNSTLFCKGSEDEEQDYGNLILGEEQVIETSQDIKESDIKVAVMHHGLEYFKEIEKIDIQTSIYDKYDLLLTGHYHNPILEISKISEYGVIKSIAGSLYESSKSYNGYTIIEITEEDYKFIYRTYYPKRRKYDLGVDIIEKGEMIVKKKKK